MANIRVIGTQTGNDVAVHDTDVGLLGGISTATGSLTIAGAGNLAFTINSLGEISFDNLVITNIVFDNVAHSISPSTTATTTNGVGLVLLGGEGGAASGSTAGGIGGTMLVQSGLGGGASGSGAGGNGGDVNITAAGGGVGTVTGAAGGGGNVNIYGGNAGTNNDGGGASGGNVTIDTGISTTGPNGTILIGTIVTSSITISTGSIPVSANGIWTFAQNALGTIASSQKTTSTLVYTCPSDVAVNQLVYMTTTADTVALASSAAASTSPAIGYIISKPTTTTCYITWVGELGGFSGLSIGVQYYLGTAGGITVTAPTTSGTVVQRVGIARNTTTMWIGLSPDVKQN